MASVLHRVGDGVARWARRTFTLDARSLGLFRIGLGLLIFTDSLVRSRDVEAFYSDVGVRPRGDVMAWMLGRPSLHLLSGDVAFEGALIGLTAVVALVLALGWRTRLFGFLTWLLVLSVQNRNNAINSGADSVMLTSCLLACFLPVGARFSVDAWRRPQRAAGDEDVYSAATLTLVVQIVVIYFFNVVNKSGGTWTEGTAVLAALHLDQHATPLGLYLREHMTGLSPPLTYGTLVIEFSAVLLLVPLALGPVRRLLVAAFWAMHAGMAVCLYLGLFAPACMVLWLAVLPGSTWEQRPWRAFTRWAGAPLTADPTTSPTATSSLATTGRRLGTAFMVWVLVTQLSLNILKVFEVAPPAVLHGPARALGVDQLWRLFSKNPSRHDGWSIVKGTLENGDVVDLLGHGPASDVRPAVIADIYKNSRWRRFMMTNSVIEEARSRKKYAAWLCHHWNETHRDGERLLKVDMVFMLETTARNFALHPPVVPEDMGHFDCAKLKKKPA